MKEWMRNWGGAEVVHAHVEDDNHTDEPLYTPGTPRYEINTIPVDAEENCND